MFTLKLEPFYPECGHNLFKFKSCHQKKDTLLAEVINP